MQEFTRRQFLAVAATVAAGPIFTRLGDAAVTTQAASRPSASDPYRALLTTWCDGLLAQQINDIPDTKLRGALRCPACGVLHGRCHDALYPMMHLAHATGESKYLDSAIKLQAWSDNVTLPTGEFTNDLDPASWKGITVFAMIALGDALHHHGQLLDDATRTRWRDRLARAAKFLDGWMRMDTGNINYPLTSSLAFTIAGDVLGEQHYVDRGREFAHHALEYLTKNNLLFGENHPATVVTPKGCRPVDVGYNVEETLPALALYAMRTNDQPVLDAVVKSLATHMEFMLPDGAWDNSWGTRMFKWTWWGSRTSDGCFPAYALLADRDARFAEVARRNLALMASCTYDGLLYGGPHLHLNGDRPCVHHTFTHAKSLATVLDSGGPLGPAQDAPVKLPCDESHGVKTFDEIRTSLISIGPWRATVTDCDVVYYKGETGHPTGGALSLLYHSTLGPICVASMTQYALVEANNMQKHGDYPTMPLTPRVELNAAGEAYTSLSDNSAQVDQQAGTGGVIFTASGALLDAKRKPPPSPLNYRIAYRFAESVTIDATAAGAKLILPVISPQHELVERTSDAEVHIRKAGGTLVIKCGSGGKLAMQPQRVFNLVPGMQCLVFSVDLSPQAAIQISVA
jgi:hypothetical protein